MVCHINYILKNIIQFAKKSTMIFVLFIICEISAVLIILFSFGAEKAFELIKTDEKKARELLIVHNLRLVVYIAKKFESTGVGIEDLISIGSIGLIKAVKTFCPDKNIKLATYAYVESQCANFNRKVYGQNMGI